MKIPATHQRRRARIEIIPLIDIMFFLLATFVIVSLSMVKNEGIDVRLPTAETGSPRERDHIVTVSITEAGELYLDKEAIVLDVLRDRLRSLQRVDPGLNVFLNGDQGADFGVVMKVFDELRLLGISRVSVQTRPD